MLEWNQTPEIAPASEPFPGGLYPLVKVLQSGISGYIGAQDSYLVTTNWETPSPHGSFPYTYVQTSSTEDEVMTSLIGFDAVNIAPDQTIYDARLTVYFIDQSVNGGDTTVHVAGIKPDWEEATATWLLAQSGSYWQTAGAQGGLDRTAPVDSKLVDYTDVGSWLTFDVTDLVSAKLRSWLQSNRQC